MKLSAHDRFVSKPRGKKGRSEPSRVNTTKKKPKVRSRASESRGKEVHIHRGHARSLHTNRQQPRVKKVIPGKVRHVVKSAFSCGFFFSPLLVEAVQSGMAAAVRAQLTIRDIRRELSYLQYRSACTILHHNTQLLIALPGTKKKTLQIARV